MKPEDKAKKVEEEREEVEGQKKKPYGIISGPIGASLVIR
jgi:hypothetical protein